MKLLAQAFLLLVALTSIGGILYPVAITGVSKLLWRDKADGSLVKVQGVVVGSKLLAQGFLSPKYFWPRPSATNFSTLPSGASNLGPTSADLLAKLDERRAMFSKLYGVDIQEIPMDLITASASGLDPHISENAARLQIARVAHARGLDESKLAQVIDNLMEGPSFGILGEKRVNVLLLNLELDRCCGHN